MQCRRHTQPRCDRLLAKAPAPLQPERLVGSQKTPGLLVPWSDTRFQFTSKQNTLPVRGEIRVGDKRSVRESTSNACRRLSVGIRVEKVWAKLQSASNPKSSVHLFPSPCTDRLGIHPRSENSEWMNCSNRF